ncbi:regulatory protein RecX [Microbacterium testaceum]|uniref:regulatory protein RecX n=1 Tax=Microbacterium testaceum TaxID=2033 RepID=UPI0007343EE8|nr:regulatory protein RecX [Microbacterium testaceum]
MIDGQRPGRHRGQSSVDGDPGAAQDDVGDNALAPVIPLFGSGRSRSTGERDAGDATPSAIVDAGARFGRSSTVDESLRSGHPSTFGRGGFDQHTPLRGDMGGPADAGYDAVAHDAAAYDDATYDDATYDDATDKDGYDGVAAARDDVRERAETLLLRKLRSRSLSISEARSVIREVQGADEVVITELIDRFVDLGYLDDAVFAEQLVLSAVERRGEGRRAVASTLMKRGIPRDIADAALAEMPDDDAERALEFARSKARGIGGKDDDAALRRLAGQLARRGYPSSIALSAARQALREVGVGRSRPVRPMSGVRFTPDE